MENHRINALKSREQLMMQLLTKWSGDHNKHRAIYQELIKTEQERKLLQIQTGIKELQQAKN